MALFGKKKKEDLTPDSLSFGFPAAEKKKDIRLTTPPAPPEIKPEAPQPVQNTQQIQPIPVPEQPPQTQPQAPPQVQPQPVMEQPRPVEPVLEKRPIIPMTMPEEIKAPRAPSIQKLRPHVFLKISKYKEVMSSIDRIMDHIKDLKKTLKNMKEVEEKETLKLKESDGIILKLEEVANVFDKIFSNPEK